MLGDESGVAMICPKQWGVYIPHPTSPPAVDAYAVSDNGKPIEPVGARYPLYPSAKTRRISLPHESHDDEDEAESGAHRLDWSGKLATGSYDEIVDG